jgi:hypothetical protein
MKKNYLKLTKKAFAFILLSFFWQYSIAQTIQTFSYTGAVQVFTVPACVSSITVDAKGAQGGTGATYNNIGGNGGRVVCVYSVSVGQVLYIYVGGQNGYNGGGTGATTYGAPGGGATDIRSGATQEAMVETQQVQMDGNVRRKQVMLELVVVKLLVEQVLER